MQVADDGIADDGSVFGMLGVDDPFTGLAWDFNGPDSANNQDSNSSFVSTSGILPPDRFPQFESWPSTRWDKPGGPFAPHTGTQYAYSQIADVSYKRLTREVAVPGRRRQPDVLDLVRHRAGLGLPGGGGPDGGRRRTGRRCRTRTGTRATRPARAARRAGSSCTRSSSTTRRSTPVSRPRARRRGRRGAWNAASGNSQGWQQWSIDLSAYAGSTVEISIAYISDWSTQNLGVFVDDITLPDGTSTSFEGGDTGGWTIAGPPPGQRREREQLDDHRRQWLPRRRHDHARRPRS